MRTFSHRAHASARFLILRSATTASAFPPRIPVAPTTFSAKSSPREVHERPEVLRGLSPTSKISSPHGGQISPSQATIDAFEGPSRPRLLNDRTGRRDLPPLKNNLPSYIALATLGVTVWGLFILYATNAERLASSVMRSVLFQLRNSVEVSGVLGGNVRLEDPWWMVGDPWVSGSVNTMQGRVDLRFRIKGSEDTGTVYFTSIRPSQGDPWRIVRYKLIADSGEVLRLEDRAEKIL